MKQKEWGRMLELLLATCISAVLLAAAAFIISMFADTAKGADTDSNGNEKHSVRQHYELLQVMLELEEKEDDGSYTQLWRSIPHGAEMTLLIAASSPTRAFGGLTGPRTTMMRGFRGECRNVFIAAPSLTDLWGDIGRAYVCTAFFWRKQNGDKEWNAVSEREASRLQKEFDSNNGSSYTFNMYMPYTEVKASKWVNWGKQQTYGEMK